jgi:hypothetical protein
VFGTGKSFELSFHPNYFHGQAFYIDRSMEADDPRLRTLSEILVNEEAVFGQAALQIAMSTAALCGSAQGCVGPDRSEMTIHAAEDMESLQIAKIY